jgi:hypothetical protein
MSKVLFALVGLLIVLGSCTQRLICPAYQSSFIHDKEALRKKFSYMQEDSTPKIFTASTSKNRYLVAVPESYRKKMRSLQTVEMKPVYPQIPDSLKADDEELLLAERDVTDSTVQQPTKGLDPGDSAYAITKTKEKYNVEQDNYMWYFRNVLVMPDVRAAMEDKKNNKEAQAKEGQAVKKGGFFKNILNIFKKKPKDSTSVSAPPLEAVTETDSASTADKPKKVKKVKAPKKKKEPTVKKKETPEKKKGDAKKEEDEDDGF